MVKISGRLVEPADDKPRSGVTLTLHSVKNSSVVLKHAIYRCVTGGNGEYSFNAAPGTYAVAVSVYGAEPERVGQIRVYSDSLPGNLNAFLMSPGEDDLTPEIIHLVDSMRISAAASASEAKKSEVQARSLASEVDSNAQAVQRNTDLVSQNTQTVNVKAQQVASNAQTVSSNTQSVTQMRDEVLAKTTLAQAAANTATQKASLAAGHEASSAENARRAEEAAQATAGALIDGGSVDLSGGVYPQPVMVGSIKRPTFWKVTKGGAVGGVDYGVGDTLIYTTSGGGSYYKIDNTESVTSVQGEKGAVTLNPEKIGAAPAGYGVGESARPATAQEQTLGGIFRDSSILYGGICIPYDGSPTQMFVGVVINENKLRFGVRTGPTSTPIKFFDALSTNTTTVDSNGFIKRASPIARLYGSEDCARCDNEYKAYGCVTVNDEAHGVFAVRESVGVYRVTGSLGFAADGWYIETPTDANGNKLLFVEYEQSHNGDIFIKTFSPDYSTGRCTAGNPTDIPEFRWIDLRLSMPIIKDYC